MPNTLNVRIQNKIDSYGNWQQLNPVLALGELGIIAETGEIRMGDGQTPFMSLSDNVYITKREIETMIMQATGQV